MELHECLRQSTLKIKNQKSTKKGTGFFILPGMIVTCAHVVEDAIKNASPVEIVYNDKSLLGHIHSIQSNHTDLAVLKVDFFEHPCVFLLDHITIGDQLYSYGYPNDNPNGDSLTLEYEGPTGKPLLYKLKGGQVLPGMSGSPLLNQTTGGICGFIKSTRDRSFDLGGRAIPAQEIFSAINGLKEKHKSFHKKNMHHWLNFLDNDYCSTILNNLKYSQMKRCIDVKTCFHHSPIANNEIFIGREKYLKMLDESWKNFETNIFCFVAWGGMGKTSLVMNWLNRMKKNDWAGASHIYIWTFHSQGTSENRQTSAELFFNNALKWFNEPNPEKIKNKGLHLADLIKKRRSIIVLDGLEPLQHPPIDRGRIKDSELNDFLKELAVQNLGLCIITTRIKIESFNFNDPIVIVKDLDSLSEKSGIELLKYFDLQGSERDFQGAVNEFGGHPLSLNLLANLIKTQYKRDKNIAHYKNIEKLVCERDNLAKHAKRILKSYEKWFNHSIEGKQYLNFLYIMGLFDRPAHINAIWAILSEPVIDGLTQEIISLTEIEINYIIDDLINLKLISDNEQLELYDCHPLIREYFGEQFIKFNSDAWKHANNRLFLFYKNLPLKELPDTFDEMEPLFQAVTHGCQAGKHQEVLEDIYWKRILREGEHYAIHVLGAINADLAALSNFFVSNFKPWSKITSHLNKKDQNSVLFFTGYDLRALGRLKEAIQPLKDCLTSDKEINDWRNAAISAGYLSELYLTLGDVRLAEDYARQSMSFPEPVNSDNIFMQRTRLSDSLEKIKQKYRLANVLHQSGNLIESEFLFREAEKEEKSINPELQYVHSLSGFWFCDLLLSLKKYDEVINRVNYTISFSKEKKWLREIALDKLSLGRAIMLKQLANNDYDLCEAKECFESVVKDLKKSKQMHYLPFGLLSRATLFRIQKKYIEARRDLSEVKDVSQWNCKDFKSIGLIKGWSSMGLFIIDYHLEYCRLLLDEQNKKEAYIFYSYAREKIQQLGYYKRSSDIEELNNIFI